jgi:hypothetical protein
MVLLEMEKVMTDAIECLKTLVKGCVGCDEDCVSAVWWLRTMTSPSGGVLTLGLQVESVVSAEYFSHKGDSRVYIELSVNEIKRYLSSSSSSNPAK